MAETLEDKIFWDCSVPKDEVELLEESYAKNTFFRAMNGPGKISGAYFGYNGARKVCPAAGLNVIVISDYFGGETTTETITLSRQQDITGLMKTFDAKTAEELAGKEIQIYMNAFFGLAGIGMKKENKNETA